MSGAPATSTKRFDAWKALPVPERRDYVLSEVAAGRFLDVCHHLDGIFADEDVLTVAALVAACREERLADFSTVMKHADHTRLLCTAVKALSFMLEELGISDEFFTVWLSHTVVRK